MPSSSPSIKWVPSPMSPSSTGEIAIHMRPVGERFKGTKYSEEYVKFVRRLPVWSSMPQISAVERTRRANSELARRVWSLIRIVISVDGLPSSKFNCSDSLMMQPCPALLCTRVLIGSFSPKWHSRKISLALATLLLELCKPSNFQMKTSIGRCFVRNPKGSPKFQRNTVMCSNPAAIKTLSRNLYAKEKANSMVKHVINLTRRPSTHSTKSSRYMTNSSTVQSGNTPIVNITMKSVRYATVQ
mmetsp:Transcript_136978/g.355795  ORF Transcript_136978/g.355795 Transcript_136978/m.355795 type:complete len:243 (+) Transcript_136978:242-970(+)